LCRQAGGGTGGGADRNSIPIWSVDTARPTACPPVRLLVLLLIFPILLHAQDTSLEASRRRLVEIRRERDRLEEQQQRLQGQVHDVHDELSNLERQRESTQRIVGEIERQIGGLSGQLDRSSAELILAEDNLAERRAVLERRLVEIYKRGPLYTFQALLAAESFGDLLSRYKYLYLTSRQDRALVTDVELLRNRVVAERNKILDVRGQLDRSRLEREAEFAKYTDLAEVRERRLGELRRSARRTERRDVRGADLLSSGADGRDRRVRRPARPVRQPGERGAASAACLGRKGGMTEGRKGVRGLARALAPASRPILSSRAQARDLLCRSSDSARQDPSLRSG
jgi:septal ring factor EnvC (AmiA/AmiB activator)